MAVSDYYVDYVSTAELLNKALKGTEDFVETLKNPQNKLEKQNKISSNQDNLVVMLRQTPKIINMIKRFLQPLIFLDLSFLIEFLKKN